MEQIYAPEYYKLTRGRLIGNLSGSLRDIDDYLFSRDAQQNQNGDFEINNCLDIDTVVLYDEKLEADFDREFEKWSVYRYHYNHSTPDRRLCTLEAFCKYVLDLPTLFDRDIIPFRVVDHVGYVMKDFYDDAETRHIVYRYSGEFPIVERPFLINVPNTDEPKLSHKEAMEILNRVLPVNLPGDGFQRFA
jgi:hypothetical protein